MQHLAAMKYVDDLLSVPGRLHHESRTSLESAARAIRTHYLSAENAHPRYFQYERLLGRELRSRTRS